MKTFRTKILVGLLVLSGLIAVQSNSIASFLAESSSQTAVVYDGTSLGNNSSTNDGGGTTNQGGGSSYNPGQSSTGGGSGALTNPLKAGTIQQFFLAILDIILVFAIPIIVLFIMYAGFLYVTAQGDEGKIRTAHAALTWSIIGGVIVLGAKLIIDVIQNTVNAI